MVNICAPYGVPSQKEMLAGAFQFGDAIKGFIDMNTQVVNAMTEGMSGLLPSGLVEVPVFGEGQNPLLVEKNTGIVMNNYLAMLRLAMGLRR